MTGRSSHLREERSSSLTINDGIFASNSTTSFFEEDELDALRDAGTRCVASWPSIVSTRQPSYVDNEIYNKSHTTATTIGDESWMLESGRFGAPCTSSFLKRPEEDDEMEDDEDEYEGGPNNNDKHDDERGSTEASVNGSAAAAASAAVDSPPPPARANHAGDGNGHREEGGRRQAMQRRGAIMSQQQLQPNNSVRRPGAYPVHGIDPRYGRRGGLQRIPGARHIQTRQSRGATPPLFLVPSSLVGSRTQKDGVANSTSVQPCAVPVKYEDVTKRDQEETGSEDPNDVSQQQRRCAEPWAVSGCCRRAQAVLEESVKVVRAKDAKTATATVLKPATNQHPQLKCFLASKLQSKCDILDCDLLSKLKSLCCRGRGVVSRPKDVPALAI